MSLLANNWHLGDRPDLGMMNKINGIFRSLDFRHPKELPNLRKCNPLIIGSDYSGQHKTSQFEAYATVFADLSSAPQWFNATRTLRSKTKLGNRRFSYKNLKDGIRAAALPHLLNAIDSIPGLLFVILVDKGIESLFKESGRIESSDHGFQTISHWTPHSIERLFRICNFISLGLAGLSRKHQDILWITDQDDIVANDRRHAEMVPIFANISSHYLEHDLRHLRIATTKSDSGNRTLEDFVAIADIAAGTICDVMNVYRAEGTSITRNMITPVPVSLSKKSRETLAWFANNDMTLMRKLVVGIEPINGSTKLSIRHYEFHASSLV